MLEQQEQLQYKLSKTRQELTQSEEMGESLDKMYQAISRDLQHSEASGKEKLMEIEALRTFVQQLQEKV